MLAGETFMATFENAAPMLHDERCICTHCIGVVYKELHRALDYHPSGAIAHFNRPRASLKAAPNGDNNV